MLHNLTALNYNGQTVRTVERDGEVWWVLVDICKVLSLKNPTSVASRLDDDEKSKVEFNPKSGLGLSHNGSTIIINESGLYAVLLRSDKPEAKPFKRWITHEVLPSIRRTGAYSSKNISSKGITVMPKKIFCDVPGNREAQKLFADIRSMAIAIPVLLEQCNCYRSEDDRKARMNVLSDICSRMSMQSTNLMLLKYATIEIEY